MDLFAAALWKLYLTGRATLRFERDDGYQDTEELSWYLTTYRAFPKFEKQALKFARRRVLDIGCGAGRHALYLQSKGLSVTAVDTSIQLVELARVRGVRDVRVASACGRMPFRNGEFDTVLLFGNNLGICGTLPRFRRMLRELYRITSTRGRILATTRAPTTADARQRAYLQRNIAQGCPVGQVRLRLSLDGKRGAWFNLLLFSPTDLMQLASREGWQVAQLFTETDPEDAYSVVLEKA